MFKLEEFRTENFQLQRMIQAQHKLQINFIYFDLKFPELKTTKTSNASWWTSTSTTRRNARSCKRERRSGRNEILNQLFLS